jgi:hypothetical protein
VAGAHRDGGPHSCQQQQHAGRRQRGGTRPGDRLATQRLPPQQHHHPPDSQARDVHQPDLPAAAKPPGAAAQQPGPQRQQLQRVDADEMRRAQVTGGKAPVGDRHAGEHRQHRERLVQTQ